MSRRRRRPSKQQSSLLGTILLVVVILLVVWFLWEEIPGLNRIPKPDISTKPSASPGTTALTGPVEVYFTTPTYPDRPETRRGGIETFVLDPNAATPEEAAAPKAKQVAAAYATVGFGSQIAASRELAGYVQGSLVRGISAKNPKSARDRGIKHASFAVLRGARMPSILAEVSFVSNPEDENRLRTPSFRQKIASSLTAGIRGYVRSAGRE